MVNAVQCSLSPLSNPRIVPPWPLTEPHSWAWVQLPDRQVHIPAPAPGARSACAM